METSVQRDIRASNAAPRIIDHRVERSAIQEFDLLCLPARDSTSLPVHEPVSAEKAVTLREREAELRKALLEIDYRLKESPEAFFRRSFSTSEKSWSPEFRIEELGDKGFSILCTVGMAALSLGPVAAVFCEVIHDVTGFVAAFAFHGAAFLDSRRWEEGEESKFLKPLGKALAFPGLFLQASWRYLREAASGQLKTIREINDCFNNSRSTGAPPPRYSLKRLSGWYGACRGLFQRGPSSEPARTFDKEIERISSSALEADLKGQKLLIARQTLELARENIETELSTVMSQLRGHEEAEKVKEQARKELQLQQQRNLHISEASDMLAALTNRLSVPEGADAAYSKKIAEKTLLMIRTLSALRDDRSTQIPQDQPAIGNFVSIMTWLEKNQASESVKDEFFSRFEAALHERLEVVCRTARGAIPGVND